MKNTTVTFISMTLFSLLVVNQGIAQPSSEPNPLSIESDSAEFDHHEGVAVHKGNVVMKQGERTLLADELRIYRSEEGKIVKLVAQGAPAKYEGKIDPKEPHADVANWLAGTANQIDYFPQKSELVLAGDAHLRYKHDTFDGPYLQYFMDTKRIYSESREDKRATIVISPDSHHS